MSANEILAIASPGKDLSALGEKAYAKGLGGDIKKNWVQQPIRLWHRDGKIQVADGHHRLAVAMGIDPNRPMPVEHQRPESF
mgnify:CR=1 FL=1